MARNHFNLTGELREPTSPGFRRRLFTLNFAISHPEQVEHLVLFYSMGSPHQPVDDTEDPVLRISPSEKTSETHPLVYWVQPEGIDTYEPWFEGFFQG